MATSSVEAPETKKAGCLSWGVGVGRGSEHELGFLPFPRPALESGFVPATLTEEESRLLLAAMVKYYVQMKASELEHEEEGFR